MATIILKSTERIDALTSSANDCQYYFNWGAVLDEGKYRVKYSICKTIKDKLTLSKIIQNKPLWARYDATGLNVGTQILSDLTGNGRNATCVSCVVSTQLSAINGSGVLMTSITGSAGTGKIQFPVGSIPAVHTICGITRYRGALATQKRILVSDQGDFLGHNLASRGTFNYGGQQLANGITSVPVINYLNFCISSTVPAPNNVLCNGVSNGIIGVPSISPFPSTLGINTNLSTDASGFELTQLFIWDRELTNIEMIVVSDNLTQFLATGVFL